MKLTISQLNLESFAINEGNRTVAYVTPKGYVDWLLISPDDEGSLITKLEVETHLGWTLGFKMLLTCPYLTETTPRITSEILDDGAKVRLVGEAVDGKGLWKGRHVATLSLNSKTRRFEWDFTTEVTCLANEPVSVPGNWLEFNNVYPGKTGRCMLFEKEKEFDRTLMVDKDGVLWNFPHQHTMHYGKKIAALKFAEGTMAGFFGSTMNPVVVIETATMEPDWGICDMYYDLHCGGRCPAPIPPGTTHRWTYKVKYLDPKEAEALERKARPLPMTADDYRTFNAPRLALGQNDFKNPIGIDRYDDGSCFIPEPPVKTWDRQTGPHGKGSLKITNETTQETTWPALPPCLIPPGTKLRLTALVKTQGVEGKGMFIRFCGHRFHWRPAPYVEHFKPIESPPVSGTQDWVQIMTPEMVTPKELVDGLVRIEVVLDGKGTAWLSDVGVEQQGVEAEIPVTNPVLT